MRIAASLGVFLLGLGTMATTVACAGEIANSEDGQSKQGASAGDPSATTPPSSKSSEDDSNSGTAVANKGTTSSTSTGSNSCWKDFGPSAPGECTIGTTRVCEGNYSDTPPSTSSSTSGGPGSKPYCLEKCVNIDGAAVWGIKTFDHECPFTDSAWHRNAGAQCECTHQPNNTPLVLSFDNRAVTFESGPSTTTAAFDLSGKGLCHGTDWPTATTPWLAFDRNDNGSIDDGSELFGSATKLANGDLAKNGFEALRELDADHNGVFDARDPAFAKLVVWSDKNNDRQSTANELVSLDSTGVTSIDLRDRREMRCDARGNCEGERSTLSFTDRSGKQLRGTVIDIYLTQR